MAFTNNVATLPTPAAAAGHNNPPRFVNEADILKEARKLGSASAAGTMKAFEFLEAVAEAVRDGAVQPSADKAKALWAAYRTAEKSKLGTLNADATTEANYKQKASNVSTVMLAAGKPGVDFLDVLARARPIIVQTKADGVHTMNTWDAFVAVAVRQKGSDTAITDAEIAAALEPKAKTPKTRNELVSLEAVIKALRVHIEGTEPTERSPGKEAFPSELASVALDALLERAARLQLAEVQAKVNTFVKR